MTTGFLVISDNVKYMRWLTDKEAVVMYGVI